MKKKMPLIMLIMIFSLILSFIPTVSAKAADASWNPVWSEEFNETSINTSNWKFETGGGGWGNNELQYYTNRSENARIENGNLVIEGRKESYNGMNYTSARLKSQGLKNWTYGKIEARIKLPVGQGIWPAFWMLGESIPQVNWPACGEIDIMEHINNESAIHGTIHWDSNGHASYGIASPNIDVTQYHVYSVEWDSSSIKWFVDGAQYLEANIANNVNSTEEFHKPFFILLNLAVGGDWPGNPDGSTAFPAKMYVDYVHVYQKGESTTPPTQNLPSTEWYLFNQPTSGVSNAGDNLIVTKTATTGWQPLKTITSTPGYWYSSLINGTYSAGTWEFKLFTNSPSSNSNVKVEAYRVNQDGTGATLIGSQTKDVFTSGSGNHTTTYSFNSNAITFNNQRLLIKISKESGADAVMCYNTNDFATSIKTP